MKDNLGIKGELHIVLKDGDGNIKQDDILLNTITNGMDAHIADQMTDSGDATIGWMAVGSGTGQSASSTDLANFINIIALSGTSPIQGTGGDDNDAIYSAFWGAGVGTGSVREAGIFLGSATSRSDMMTYNDALTVNKGASDTLKIDWTVTFGAS